MQNIKHYLRVLDCNANEIITLIERAIELKKLRKQCAEYMPAKGRVLGMLFEKPSTRTRVSFEAAMYQLGGSVCFLPSRDLQLQRGEPLKDTARVLSRYVDVLAVRTFSQDIVDELAKWASIPVINALTDSQHPCQILSDMMTVIELKGKDFGKLKVAWVGDGNNMANSWMELSARLGFEFKLACPEGYMPNPEIVNETRKHGARLVISADPKEAVEDADVINTDVWASMGQEGEAEARKAVFQPYQVNSALVSLAKKDAIVLHCLPAHRDEEITDEVLEGAQSVAWEQAENKLHIHKAILEWAMGLRGSV